MSAMIEMVNGVASFAENGRKERAWHGLGQVVDEPMFVADALKLCHADYSVKLQPVVALSDEILAAIQNGEMIEADKLLSLMINNTRATMRTDTNKSLGMVSCRTRTLSSSWICSVAASIQRETTPQLSRRAVCLAKVSVYSLPLSSHSLSYWMRSVTIW